MDTKTYESVNNIGAEIGLPIMHSKLHRLCTFSGLSAFILFAACSLPEGLTSVSGVEGSIIINKSLFEAGEIKGVSLVVLDELEPDSLANHFIAFSDPVLPCDSAAKMICDSTWNFFIQLKQGGYIIFPVGLLVEPSFFVVNIDSLLSEPDIPIVIPEFNISNFRSFLIREENIYMFDEPWVISFEYFIQND